MFEINEQRLKRYSYQIAFLVGEILPALNSGKIDDAVKKSIIRLSEIANEIGFRLQNSNFEHVSNLCHNLINVTSSIRRNLRDLNQKDIDLLKPLSDAIVVSFNPEKASAEFTAEVTQMVRDKYRQRQEEERAAGAK